MTIIRLGYVAMSEHVKNASPSQTMTFAQFSKIADRDAAIRKLERIAASNIHNCLRLLRHNAANDIAFFRLSSRLIPLANHPELKDWNFIRPLKESLDNIKEFLMEHPDMRVDFHPDHFVLLNTPDKETLQVSIKTLRMHEMLLKSMGIDTEHRCVLHVGGGYNDHEQALEQFIHNWGLISPTLQKMIMLENDDTTFTLSEGLYLCEKLGIPLVFDYHHFMVHHHEHESLENDWDRIIKTWNQSQLPPKMHISSPRSERDFRAHADYVDSGQLVQFLDSIKGSVPRLDCMIEAKKKDEALFALIRDLEQYPGIEKIDGGSFYIK
ncbi:UV DNA damage repair endonuclease UvsE [Peribacillus sp. SCS-155]|uniref:UV DNA damage repair endonuclease UvsE n=1 Tax=Peribacillus sedimenti TaxID=3115297 RepID=UPI003906BB5D